LPDLRLIHRVTGCEDVAKFDTRGHLDLEAFATALTGSGRRLESFRHVLDFGCGCGRLLRRLRQRCPEASIAGCDIDGDAIEWVRENLPEVDARITGGLPPLPYAPGSFDLVIACSVFTHLDEAYQDAWLAELRRITMPGAMLLVTVLGNRGWRWHAENPLFASAHKVEGLAQQLSADGIVFWRDDGWECIFPDFYHTTFHLPGYIETHWNQGFDVIGLHEGAIGYLQDLVVLHRLDTDAPSRNEM